LPMVRGAEASPQGVVVELPLIGAIRV
jgi:hypothetical protein